MSRCSLFLLVALTVFSSLHALQVWAEPSATSEPAPVVGSIEYPILGLHWGMDAAAIQGALPGEPIVEEDVENTLWREATPDLMYVRTDFGLSGRLKLNLDDTGGLAEVVFHYDTSLYESNLQPYSQLELKKLLMGQYGEPLQDGINGGGDHETNWETPTSRITLLLVERISGLFPHRRLFLTFAPITASD